MWAWGRSSQATSLGVQVRVSQREVLDLDLEEWIKPGPEDIKGKVFIYKEGHKLRLGSNKGSSIMEGREVHLAETEWDRSAVSRLLWGHYGQVTKAPGLAWRLELH